MVRSGTLFCLFLASILTAASGCGKSDPATTEADVALLDIRWDLSDGRFPNDTRDPADGATDHVAPNDTATDLPPDQTVQPNDQISPDTSPTDLNDIAWPPDLTDILPNDTVPADQSTDLPADVPLDQGPDIEDLLPDVPPSIEPWWEGPLTQLPAKTELLDLPGGGTGNPVVTSNNPESFEGKGFLYQTARTDPVRGGVSTPMAGTFGVYLHHLNKTGKTMYVHILLTNPNDGPVTVSGFGSGYNQTETGGLGFGYGPDVQVAKDWLSGDYNHTLAPGEIGSFKARTGWVKQLANGAELDGRFQFTASQGVYVYVIAAETNDVNDAVSLTQIAAPGDIKPPGNPPPPFGREAGVYAHDTWTGQWSLSLPSAGQTYHVGYIVNTATGAGVDQIQAFPAITHFSDSSAESVGMYGNTYELTVDLQNPGPSERQVDIIYGALGSGNPSFYFNGPILFNGVEVMTLLTPTNRVQTLGTVTLAPASTQSVSLSIFIQGLSSIPQALFLEAK